MQKIVINLHNRQDKFNNTINELRKVPKLSDFVIRFEAITSEKAKDKCYNFLHKDAFINIENVQNTNIIPNYSAVGCALSHIECWKYIVDNHISDCIIIEDDIEIVNKDHFLVDYNNLLNTIKKNNFSNIKRSMFITFNSKIFPYLPSTNKFVNNKGFNCIKFLNTPFIGLHFYYLNNKMANYLLKKLKKIKYQLDIEIGILASIVYPNIQYSDPIFGNIPSNDIIQSKKFSSDIQYYNISFQEISEFLYLYKIPDDVSKLIYEYIPECFKINRKDEDIQISRIYKNIYDYLDTSNYYY